MTDYISLRAAHGLRLVSSSDLARHDISDDNWVIMQFTGLLDKNGKEAYENDIAIHPGDGSVCKIVFENAFGGYGFRDVQNAWQGQLRSGLEFEIIGNIYENPILLNEMLGDVHHENLEIIN
jgi:hypothetical protein